MNYEPGDLVKNDNYKCKYGIIVDKNIVSHYTTVLGIITESQKYTWDDSDTRFLHTFIPGDIINDKDKKIPYEFRYFDFSACTIHLLQMQADIRLSMSITTFLKDFDITVINKNTSTRSNGCSHDYKPWPFDMFKEYCKHCGKEKT